MLGACDVADVAVLGGGPAGYVAALVAAQRGARVILDQVLPAYAAAKEPATEIAQASGKTVDITLVRWPYT